MSNLILNKSLESWAIRVSDVYSLIVLLTNVYTNEKYWRSRDAKLLSTLNSGMQHAV